MTTEIMVNILSILAICISLASVALCIYGRVQERRVAAAIASVRIRTPRTPPLMANRVIVVRCKDCKYRDPEDNKCDCGHAIQWQLPRDDDWFCADGERRDDE